mmetsp:Transcript_6311/g.9572  ORF Transcript_6311/g.9572 Transcript_6311/m.9572 type:complete len:89 (-) Transcript_6311:48-314(-)
MEGRVQHLIDDGTDKVNGKEDKAEEGGKKGFESVGEREMGGGREGEFETEEGGGDGGGEEEEGGPNITKQSKGTPHFLFPSEKIPKWS